MWLPRRSTSDRPLKSLQAIPRGQGQTLSAWTVGHAPQAVTLIGAMREKIAAVGSDGRRTGIHGGAKGEVWRRHARRYQGGQSFVPVYALTRTSASREFFARFLLDTHSASRCRSTRHSDTSRNGRKFSRCIKSASATRHLNATLVTRHSNAKITPILHSPFFLPVLSIRLPFAFSPAPAHSMGAKHNGNAGVELEGGPTDSVASEIRQGCSERNL
jgi:hypothetical protein